MLYKISKPGDDSRAMCAGYVVPDGYYRLVEGTLYNADALKHVATMWLVDEYEGTPDKPGLYRVQDDMLVDQWSALDYAMGGHEEPVAPGPDYRDPGVSVGMPDAMLAKRYGTRQPINPVLQERASRLREQAAETVAEMSGRAKPPKFMMA